MMFRKLDEIRILRAVERGQPVPHGVRHRMDRDDRLGRFHRASLDVEHALMEGVDEQIESESVRLAVMSRLMGDEEPTPAPSRMPRFLQITLAATVLLMVTATTIVIVQRNGPTSPPEQTLSHNESEVAPTPAPRNTNLPIEIAPMPKRFAEDSPQQFADAISSPMRRETGALISDAKNVATTLASYLRLDRRLPLTRLRERLEASQGEG